jgi:hypothetical protein
MKEYQLPNRGPFKERGQVCDLILLYLEGTSVIKIGRHFEIDRTTVLYHIQKLGIWQPRPWWRPRKYPPDHYYPNGRIRYAMFRRPTNPPLEKRKTYKYQHLFEEKTRRPKTYAEIYADAQKRGDRSLAYASRPPAAYRDHIAGPDIHT